MIKTVIIALILCMIEILVIVVASPLANPAVVLRFLPKDVREAAKDHPAPPVSKQIIAHALLAVFLIAMISGVIYVGINGIRNGLSYWQLTAHFIVLLYVMKAFDIIVQDQWLVMTVGYFKKIYPETSECAGWKDRSFNNRNQIIRVVVYPFLSMITAGIFVLLCK